MPPQTDRLDWFIVTPTSASRLTTPSVDRDIQIPASLSLALQHRRA